MIRKSLITIWQKYKNIDGDKIPMWIVPLEVIKQNRLWKTFELKLWRIDILARRRD